jgi:hypothetical protein
MDMSYKVELTGHTRYFAVIDEEKDREWTVVEFYDENSDSSDWEVMDEQGKCVGGKKRVELIETVEAYIKEQKGKGVMSYE